jgi:hypothetical protein
MLLDESPSFVVREVKLISSCWATDREVKPIINKQKIINFRKDIGNDKTILNPHMLQSEICN